MNDILKPVQKMLIFATFLLIFVLGECKILDLMDVHDHVQKMQNLRHADFHPIYLESLEFLKDPKLHYSFAAGLPEFALNVTTECSEDLAMIFATLMNDTTTFPGFDQIFAQIKDAFGAQAPGLQRGPQAFYGFKQECDIIKYQAPNSNRIFRTAYSRAYLTLTGNCSEIAMGFDVCLPKTCSSSDLMELIDLVSTLSPNMTALPICTVTTYDDVNVPMSTMAWLTLVLIGILVALGILAGLADYFLIPQDSTLRSGTGAQAFLAFSLYTNISEILRAPKIKKGQIGAINCIRVISMFWVILGHIFEVMLAYSNNFRDFLAALDYILIQVVENAFFSVDSFFFIGGVLLSFMWFKAFEKDKRTLTSPYSWIMFYVHRFIRLSVPYYVVLLAYAYLYGPMTQNRNVNFSPHPVKLLCRENIWKNMLYFANLIDATKICMGHTWYLATDMQIFVLTPAILIPLAWSPILGIAVAFLLLFLSTSANVITVYLNHYPPTFNALGPADPEQINYDLYMRNMYYAMWIRCQIYIMGILVGWMLQRFKKIQIHPLINLIGWALSLALMLTVVFGLFHYFRGHQLPLFWRAAYSALSKPAWGLGLSWIIISCYYGYGGPINQFMSWNIWVPLGRLSYCAYLVHGPVLLYIFGMEENAIYYSSAPKTLITFFLPTVFVTFAFALLVSALVEIPTGKLETLLFKPRNRVAHQQKAEIVTWDLPETKNGQVIAMKIEHVSDERF